MLANTKTCFHCGNGIKQPKTCSICENKIGVCCNDKMKMHDLDDFGETRLIWLDICKRCNIHIHRRRNI